MILYIIGSVVHNASFNLYVLRELPQSKHKNNVFLINNTFPLQKYFLKIPFKGSDCLNDKMLRFICHSGSLHFEKA